MELEDSTTCSGSDAEAKNIDPDVGWEAQGLGRRGGRIKGGWIWSGQAIPCMELSPISMSKNKNER
jgi:hypothetical protein